MSLEEMRADILDLGERYPELAGRYTQLRNELDQPDTQSIEGTSQLRWHGRANRRHEAGRKFDGVIGEIPGFKSFLRAPGEAEMQQAATNGPIVVVNVSVFRCDAILVEKHGVCSVPLIQLKIKEIQEKVRQESLGRPEVLEWLWDTVGEPVLAVLGFTEPVSDLPHIWWIPTGLLSKFPLHAAGCHSLTSSRTVIDRVVSSYSSSIKAMIRGRRHAVPSGSIQALLVMMEHTPHCEIFHFAGHGSTDYDDPSKSHLFLEDGKTDPLKVADLLEINLREAPFLAYLSACGTGRIRQKALVDESIHLISGCQIAGFRHVVGTLWDVMDELCVDVARITYQVMVEGGMSDDSVGRGIHKATKELRDKWLNEGSFTESAWKLRLLSVNDISQDVSGRGRGDELQRDVVVSNEEYLDAPLWVPYVHFGV